jgi:arginase family enzyme
MEEIVNKVGKDGKPVYISFDIDSLDPAFAPGYQPMGIHVLLIIN